MAVLAVLPDFFTVKVKVQVPLDLITTDEDVATQALLGFAFTPTNFTLVDLTVLTPNFFTTVRAEKVPFFNFGLLAFIFFKIQFQILV